MPWCREAKQLRTLLEAKNINLNRQMKKVSEFDSMFQRIPNLHD